MCKGLATLNASCLKSAKDIKHKIILLLHKSEPKWTDEKIVKEKTTAPVRRPPTEAEVEKWKESFSDVMNSKNGRTVFGSFLSLEFSKENMDFWVDCENFKKTSPNKVQTRAKQIYLQYVAADSRNEVNLDAVTREETRQNVKSASPSCFHNAQKEIYNLMEKDSYRRFLKSKLI